jgi:hypothetical protein
MIDKPEIVNTDAQPAAIIRFTIPKAEFAGWIKGEGHTPGPNFWERYVAGPESGPNPANWRTELNQPLSAQRT